MEDSMVTKEVTGGAMIGDTIVSPRVSPLLSPSVYVSPHLLPSLNPMPAIDNTSTISVTPSPTPTIIVVTPTLSVSPSVTSTADSVPSSIQSSGRVVINEIAWMGTSAGKTGSDEWIELYNTENEDVNLSGWILKSETDDSPHITLSGAIPAHGYYLLERTDDTVISDIKANYTGSFGPGGLKNDGEILILQDKAGNIVDSVNCSKGWFYGDNIAKSSMERRDSSVDGNNRSNWASNNHTIRNGLDVNGSPINGTPAHRNSAQI
ncbi:MAG: Polymorphic membrane protein [Parcubacteria group bacterium GW2011_GWC1_39_29]|nr:MAG: Polymorphic membrane protein [Parcubacteria group bacterium GW2011_GWC1_39_29]